MKACDENTAMRRLLDIMARLRSEDGCPWDREQTVDSIKSNLIEECYETIDAIEDDDLERHKEELGDVLLQVVFHARIREEEGGFDFADVARTVADKLVRRHPHVFGEERADDSADVLRAWERIKRAEKGTEKHSSTFKGLPRSMPALQQAGHVQSRAARLGFDWKTIKPVMGKIDEELSEIKTALHQDDKAAVEEEIGDLLFAVVNLTRFVEADPEELLHRSIRKFIDRFRRIEEGVAAEGRVMTDCSLDELDRYWEEAKQNEK